MADTNTNYLTKVEMDWEEIDRKVKLHRKKQLRRLAIIAACCVAGFAALYIGSQLKAYNKYKVINSTERTDTDAARFMLLDGKLLKYSNDGAFYTTAGNELIWNQTFEMQKPIAGNAHTATFAEPNNAIKSKLMESSPDICRRRLLSISFSKNIPNRQPTVIEPQK